MNIIDFLPQHIKEHVVCIFKCGSQLFCDKYKDIDYTIITKIPTGHHIYYINELKTDCFIYSLDEFIENINDDKWRYKLSVSLAYHNNENVIFGELPILNTNVVSRDFLLKTAQIEYEFAKTHYFSSYPSKTMIWGLALYYIIENDSFEFTSEQKNILQKCHDLELSSSYRDQLESYLQQLNN